jgi:glycosyltransferase involved in cell wall biosynthesis
MSHTTPVQADAPSIAIGIVSRNEARELEACLASVPWATEIYVLDMKSTDDTCAVAEKFGATVIAVREAPVAEQVRNAYLTRFTSDWMLQLDCDERVNPNFHDAIVDILMNDDVSNVAAFVLPFRLYACGVPIDHGMGKNGSVRFFRRNAVRYSDEQGAHRNPILDGELRDVTGRVPPIEHYAITSVEQYLQKSLRYARSESVDLTVDQLDPLVMFRTFYQLAVANEGWRDGFAGLAFTAIFAFSRGLPHAYAWERLGHPKIAFRRNGRAVTTQSEVRRAFNDTSSGPLFTYAFANATSDDVTDIGQRYLNAARYRPSLLVHPTTWKALVKYSGVRSVQRVRTFTKRAR